MSDAKKCDRCYRYYDPETYKDALIVYKKSQNDNTKRRDLCPKCYKKLVRWMNRFNPDFKEDDD